MYCIINEMEIKYSTRSVSDNGINILWLNENAVDKWQYAGDGIGETWVGAGNYIKKNRMLLVQDTISELHLNVVIVNFTLYGCRILFISKTNFIFTCFVRMAGEVMKLNSLRAECKRKYMKCCFCYGVPSGISVDQNRQ